MVYHLCKLFLLQNRPANSPNSVVYYLFKLFFLLNRPANSPNSVVYHLLQLFILQNRPANSLKLDSKYLPLGVNPTLSQASNSLVSNALAANAFSTGLASNALNLKKSLERISENVSMSMANRNALSLPQSFRNAASAAKGCKNYPQGNIFLYMGMGGIPDISLRFLPKFKNNSKIFHNF